MTQHHSWKLICNHRNPRSHTFYNRE